MSWRLTIHESREERKIFFDDKKKLEHDSIWDLHQPFLFLFIRLFLFDIIRFDSSFGEEINQIHQKQNCKVGKFWNAVKNCSLTESISSDKVKWNKKSFVTKIDSFTSSYLFFSRF